MGLEAGMADHSGWFLERRELGEGRYEALITSPAPGRGLVHVTQSPAVPFTLPEIWRVASRIRNASFPGPFIGASIVRSTYGNLEAVCAQADGGLAHFWKSDRGGWRGPIILPAQAGAAPAFIQGRYGGVGNFEVVVPQAGGGLAHLWRDNDRGANPPWRCAQQPDTGDVWSGVALLYSSFGNLEAVGIRNGELICLTQNWAGGAWVKSAPLDTKVQGSPALVQTTYAQPGNFDVVVAKVDGGLAHYWRDNAAVARTWYPTTRFGPREIAFDDVAILQCSSGALEVLARVAGQSACKRFRRSAPDAGWDGPYTGTSFSGDP